MPMSVLRFMRGAGCWQRSAVDGTYPIDGGGRIEPLPVSIVPSRTGTPSVEIADVTAAQAQSASMSSRR